MSDDVPAGAGAKPRVAGTPGVPPRGGRWQSPLRWLRRLGWGLVGLFLAGLVVFDLVVPQVAGANLLPAGTAAPLIRLDDDAGHSHDVFAEAGAAPIAINFFATDCSACRDEVPAWCAVVRAHPAVTFVGVEAAGHGAADIAAYARELGGGCLVSEHVILLADPGGHTGSAYHIIDTPTVYLIRSGHVVAAGVGGDQLTTVVNAAGSG